MKSYIANNKGFVIAILVLSFLLVGSTVLASTVGAGAESPPAEEERGKVSRKGGMFLIWYSGGSGKGIRGVGGRGGAGGPGAGK